MEKLIALQQLTIESIGTKDIGRRRASVFERTQLIKELTLNNEHLNQTDTEIRSIMKRSQEGRILTSLPGIGPIQATIISAIVNIDNFPNAASLKSYFGWTPVISQTGTSMNRSHITRAGTRTIKQMMFLIIDNAFQMDCEWKRIYKRLSPIKCSFDERMRAYKCKLKVVGRLAGQITSIIFVHC